MKKGAKKSRTERRRIPRGPRSVGKTKSARESAPDSRGDLSDTSGLVVSQENCCACGKGLSGADRALFVEEEVGRVFCSESCITQHFQIEIEEIEKDYFKHRPKDDLSPEEREQYAHLRWVTIQEPDEVWRERRPSGDYRHTLISQFKPGPKAVWCVCICLFLRGEPSFLYMAFPTRSKALVEKFRRGKKIEQSTKTAEPGESPSSGATEETAAVRTDGLADGWSQSETLRAEIHQTRDANDIPPEEYALYEGLLEKTLEEPDELWVMHSKDDGEPDRYHFIKFFPDEEGGPMHYVVIARESEQEEHLEVIEQIPTRDLRMVRRYRRGRQELVLETDDSAPKTIH